MYWRGGKGIQVTRVLSAYQVLSLDRLYRKILLEGKMTEAQTFSVTMFLLIRSLITTLHVISKSTFLFTDHRFTCECVCGGDGFGLR